MFYVLLFLAIGGTCAQNVSCAHSRDCIQPLICNYEDRHCDVCRTDADCFYGYYTTHTCTDAECVHKPLVPIGAADITTVLIVTLGAFVSAGAGTGGGGIFVPVFMVVLAFSAKEAIPLSKSMILGGGIANFLFNVRKRHPQCTTRPLIDYKACSVLEPMTLLGTTVGVWLNVITPNWLIITLLVALLMFLSYDTFNKGLVLYRKEVLAANAAIVLSDVDYDSEHEMLARHLTSTSGNSTHDHSQNEIVKYHTKQVLLETIDTQESRFPWIYVLAQTGVAAVFLVLVILKGAHGTSVVGVVRCSPVYWVIVLCIWMWLASTTTALCTRLIYEHRVKVQAQYTFLEGDVHWTPRTCIMYPLMCVGAGLFAGLLGIGGGMVKGPLMLRMNMNPQVVAASTSFMILFTSTSTVVQYWLQGVLLWDYALMYSSIGFCATLGGQTLLAHVLKRNNKQSYLVFLMAGVISLSGLLLTSISVRDIAADFEKGTNLSFKPLCS